MAAERSEAKPRLPWPFCWSGRQGNLRKAGAEVPWRRHTVQKIMKPDVILASDMHMGSAPWGGGALSPLEPEVQAQAA